MSEIESKAHNQRHGRSLCRGYLPFVSGSTTPSSINCPGRILSVAIRLKLDIGLRNC
jgi:hypothetical protein